MVNLGAVVWGEGLGDGNGISSVQGVVIGVRDVEIAEVFYRKLGFEIRCGHKSSLRTVYSLAEVRASGPRSSPTLRTSCYN